MVTEGGWKPNRSLDVASRRAKAGKIATLVERRRPLPGAAVLEIGTGAGIIASLLAARVGDAGTMMSVDVDDLRTVTAGYHFQRVDGVRLPFAADAFDVVVSNHTIEHVGGTDAQLTHLCEVARVLRPGGIAYLASPNRWALVEPHFKVPLLSWLPPRLRTRALRLSGRGSVYDIHPRTRAELMALIASAGLGATDITVDALRVASELEPGRVGRIACRLPDRFLARSRPAFPTLVFLLDG